MKKPPKIGWGDISLRQEVACALSPSGRHAVAFCLTSGGQLKYVRADCGDGQRGRASKATGALGGESCAKVARLILAALTKDLRNGYGMASEWESVGDAPSTLERIIDDARHAMRTVTHERSRDDEEAKPPDDRPLLERLLERFARRQLHDVVRDLGLVHKPRGDVWKLMVGVSTIIARRGLGEAWRSASGDDLDAVAQLGVRLPDLNQGGVEYCTCRFCGTNIKDNSGGVRNHLRSRRHKRAFAVAVEDMVGALNRLGQGGEK